ncbi:unnamed protein product, partial [Effrenium voratum]
MSAKVVDEPSNFQDEWLTEAERLRRRLWGGAVVDLSHRLVDPGAPKVHILYNGSTHYDALVRLESTLGWEPAWPQTGRPRYFKETTAARPVAASGPSPREIQEQNLIGDSLFGVETGDSLRERVIDVAGTEADLQLHLAEAHSCDLMAGARLLLPSPGAAGKARPLRSFAAAVEGDKVEALICASCACIYSRVAEFEEQNEIQWRWILSRCGGEEEGEWRLFGQPAPRVVEILGLNAFLDKHDKLHSERAARMSTNESFENWKLKLPGPGGAEILCCPEDRRCGADPTHVGAAGVLCEERETPVCRACFESLKKKKMPPVSLANDMWVGYSPERIFEEKMTALELICASPCVTTMVCMSMEARHRHASAPFDETAHMARHRYGFRGNPLTFPLPWEDLMRELQSVGEEAAALPRAGVQLSEVVRVLLKTNQHGQTSEAEIKTLIHQANVRREVAVNLILDMKRLGHPSFIGADEDAVRARAAALPEDGAPPEVLRVVTLLDGSEKINDKLLPQKAATPVDGRSDAVEAGRIFAAQRPRGVVAEGEQALDLNQTQIAAMRRLQDELTSDAEKALRSLEVRTGNQLVDQFQPLYFAVAFCFCFKFGTVDIHAWAAAMQRRVESQFRRGWNFGYSIWNYIFRTAVNLQKNVYMYSIPDESNPERRRPMTGKEVLKGASDLLRALDSKYADVSGELKAVKGDLAKTRYCDAEDPWQEVRTTMRLQTHANRVCYGLSVFLTFSPSERDTALMLRLARVRQSDPSLQSDRDRSFQSRSSPKLDEEFCRLSPEALLEELPDYDERKTRSVYCRPDLWQEGLRETVEADWPEYKDSSLMLSRPAYQTDASMSPADWKARFLEVDVEELQQRKQQHVHLPGPDGQRQPLAHCQDARDPSKCKSGFPRDKALVDGTVLVCPGLGQKFELPVKGKRSLLGVCWGPVNEPNLNGNHPAFLAALRCNGDLQLPYRFPITTETHSDSLCEENCAGRQAIRLLIREAQLTQDRASVALIVERRKLDMPVNAADIKGKTIHNVCGLSADWKAVDRAVSKEVAKRMGLWRWLIIDEVSMVNARLLAQVDQRLRSAVPDAAAWKLDPVTNSSRPFAGINVLFTVNCLPPDDLTAPDPLADYGRERFWGGAVQGVTELEERERCKDGWWNAVVDELRAGPLSERNWKYLHGLPVEGCALSDEERASRRRVVAGHSDPRLQEAKFKQAPVIVANTDAKFQINKDRALRYSKESGAPLRWAAAADRPGLAILQTQACDKAARVRWLQHHDRDTGNLCGMLPLAVGMKVALTEHLDRSEDKLLLRGATGFVHSWRWPPGARQPTHVYVKFQGAEWQLEGTPEPGLYPVTRQTKVWFLDGGRPKPVLRISRTQIPLVPAYAITAHGSQGKTLPAAMADFNVDRWSDITFGTVAGSRVRSREDILILRPFPLWLFQRGAPEGPELLRKTLRGEKIDWVNYREARAPSAPCQQCKVVKPFDYFADAQWDKARANLPATCLTCIHKDGGACKRKLPSNVERLRCIGCGFEKVEHACPRAQLRQPRAEERRNCIACLKNVSELTCSQCAEVKPLKEFHLSALTLPWAAACQSCLDAVRGKARRLRAGWEKCRGCAAFLPTSSAVYINQRCPNC